MILLMHGGGSVGERFITTDYSCAMCGEHLTAFGILIAGIQLFFSTLPQCQHSFSFHSLRKDFT